MWLIWPCITCLPVEPPSSALCGGWWPCCPPLPTNERSMVFGRNDPVARSRDAARSVRSPATKQRARPHRCHREVARGQVSVIVEHTDDDRCEDRRDDKQHHYADHERPPIFALPSCESGQRGTSWARRLLRGGHSRGAPTKLVNAVADEHGMVSASCGSTRSMPSCGRRRSGQRRAGRSGGTRRA